jgi:pyruvate carboxylase
MHKRQQLSTFQSYLKDRDHRIKRALSEVEKQGVEGALDRCRLLMDQINRDLRGKKFGHFVNDVSSLAEFQVSIERAASLLNGIAAYGKNQPPVDSSTQRQAAA